MICVRKMLRICLNNNDKGDDGQHISLEGKVNNRIGNNLTHNSLKHQIESTCGKEANFHELGNARCALNNMLHMNDVHIEKKLDFCDNKSILDGEQDKSHHRQALFFLNNTSRKEREDICLNERT